MKKTTGFLAIALLVLAGCQTSENLETKSAGPHFAGSSTLPTEPLNLAYKPHKASELISQVKFVVNFSGKAEEGILEANTLWSSETISSGANLQQFYTSKSGHFLIDGEITTLDGEAHLTVTRRVDGAILDKEMDNFDTNEMAIEITQFLLPLDKIFNLSNQNTSPKIFFGKLQFDDKISMDITYNGSIVGLTDHKDREALVTNISGAGDFYLSKKRKIPVVLSGYALIDLETGNTLVEDILFEGQGTGPLKLTKITITSKKQLSM